MNLPRRFDDGPAPFPRPGIGDRADEEQTISRTDDDALGARASAVKCGYWEDDLLKCFVKAVDRKPPIINRGTHVRTFAIDRIVRAFLDAPPSAHCAANAQAGGVKKQILSLGAGSDTRYFRLAKQHMQRGEDIPFRYHEVDFPHVTQRKALTLTSKRPLKEVLHHRTEAAAVQVDARRGSIVSDGYCLHAADLRDIASLAALPNLDRDIDTLVISEVCLIYLDPAAADACVRWADTYFTDAARAICIYEPIGGHDAFGRMMVRNLAQRGLELKTLAAYPDVPSQTKRLRDAGFATAHAVTTRTVHDDWLDAAERERMTGLEMLDEVEEWYMLAEHYCVSVGWTGEALSSLADLF